MFKKTLLAASLSALSFTAIAGATPFEGVYVGASLNFANFEFDAKNSVSSFDNDGTDAALGLNLGYGALFNTFYLGTEVGVKTSNGKANTANGLATFKANESWDISVLPGFLLNDSTLVYGRIGMGSMNGKLKDSSIGYSKADNFDTMVWGLGFETPFTQNLLGRFEVSRTAFDKKYSSTAQEWSGDSTAISLGIQSNF